MSCVIHCLFLVDLSIAFVIHGFLSCFCLFIDAVLIGRCLSMTAFTAIVILLVKSLILVFSLIIVFQSIELISHLSIH